MVPFSPAPHFANQDCQLTIYFCQYLTALDPSMSRLNEVAELFTEVFLLDAFSTDLLPWTGSSKDQTSITGMWVQLEASKPQSASDKLKVTCSQAGDYTPGPASTLSITSYPFSQEHSNVSGRVTDSPSHLLDTQLQELPPRRVSSHVWVPPWLETSLNSIVKITSFRDSNANVLRALMFSLSCYCALSFLSHLLILSSFPSSDHNIPTTSTLGTSSLMERIKETLLHTSRHPASIGRNS